MRLRSWAALVLLSCAGPLPAQEQGVAVRESARRIPVAYQADVAVVGGSTGAVSAAVSAAQQGAKVFLAAPRPYLGEDMCAPLRLWLEAEERPTAALARKLYARKRIPNTDIDPYSLAEFQYEADRPPPARWRSFWPSPA